VILVDSSVWIDYFRGRRTAQTDALNQLLGSQPLLLGDLVLAEVLQGFQREPDFRLALQLLQAFQTVSIVGPRIAVQAARNYRGLRSRGVTVRKTIDTLIATYCIEHGVSLLYADRDFDPFVQHLGLISAI
jgi:predicted nucleic acid-binding protein